MIPSSRRRRIALGHAEADDEEQVLVAPLPSGAALSALKSSLQRRTGVINVTAADHFPGGPINDAVHIPEGACADEGIHFESIRN